MYDYPVDVMHSTFENCKGWGIIQDLRGPGQYLSNRFENLMGAIQISLSAATIAENSIAKTKQGLSIIGSADIVNNKIIDTQNGIEIFRGAQVEIRDNQLRGIKYPVTGKYRTARLKYLENRPLEAVNAKYGIIVNQGNLADMYLFNMASMVVAFSDTFTFPQAWIVFRQMPAR
jgi:hypothetical protein